MTPSSSATSAALLLLSALCTGLIEGTIVTEEGSDPVVKTQDGQLQGTILQSRGTREYFAFKGVRYGNVPARFEASQATGPWEGVKNAAEFGSECPQTETGIEQNIVLNDEDCLYLNIYVPKLEKSIKDLPVMVWIHGGAFVEGAGSNFGADYLMDEDVILVTFNYRLGLLGFLNTGDGLIPGNNGLKDQILALKWVQRNIKSFHGDPNRVTIFGESAGGASVHALVISPLAKGLFHGAIAQSGSMLNPWALVTKPEKWAAVLADSVNCPVTPTQDMIDCLRNRDLEILLTIQKNLTLLAPDYLEPRFAPSIDSGPAGEAPLNPVLPSDPYDLILREEGSKVPFVIGLNEGEGYLFFADILLVTEKLMKFFNKNWANRSPQLFRYDLHVPLEEQEEFGRRLRRIYIEDDEDFSLATEDTLVDLYSHVHFYRGIRIAAELHSQTNPNVFPYVFTQKGRHSISNLFGIYERAPTHVDELQYLFKSLKKDVAAGWPPLYHEVDIEFSKKFVKLWTSFAVEGKPTNSLGLDWDASNVVGKPLGTPLPWFGINLKPKKKFQYSQAQEEKYLKLEHLFAKYEKPQVTWRVGNNQGRDEL